ncbi:MAG: flagellar basal body P-ring protein FlgI [Phycisphaerae bacterium]
MARWIVTFATLAAVSGALAAERIKDIVDIKGVRGNPLHGVGAVIGLNGTGDGSKAIGQMLASILRKKGIVLQPGDLTSKNAALVLVTAELGPWTRRDSRIDVTVSSAGAAMSLQGGKLVATELQGLDGQVYAVAQGSVVIGGFSATGQNATITKNHTTVGQVPGGAIVEREEIAEIVEKGEISLLLRNPDYATASRVAEEINKLHPQSSNAVDAGTVRIRLPESVTEANVAAFIARIGEPQVTSDMPAVVVINERTGTIVVGESVRISKVAISHGNLSIITEEIAKVSQPNVLSRTGTTTVTNRTAQKAIESKGELHLINTANVSELARALNAMGLTPRDLIAIFGALKKAGALQADVKTM